MRNRSGTNKRVPHISRMRLRPYDVGSNLIAALFVSISNITSLVTYRHFILRKMFTFKADSAALYNKTKPTERIRNVAQL